MQCEAVELLRTLNHMPLNMTKHTTFKSLVVSGALLSAPFLSHLPAQDDTTDILIDVLVRKGILSESEASEIRDEVAIVAEAQKAEVVESAVRAAASSSAVPMPKSLENLKLYGDARFRLQSEEVDSADTRTRFRYRARVGANYYFKESPFSMGLRMESSSANDSTNQTYGGFFDKTGDEVYFGLAYLKYAGEDMTISAGKHKHPFKISSQFWDSDINPEGISESFEAGNFTFNFGQYIIDDEREDRAGAGDDDFLFGAQMEWSNGDGLTIAPIFLTTTDGVSTVSEGATFKGENSNTYFRNFSVLAVPVEYSFSTGDGIKQKMFGTLGINFDADKAIADPGSPYFNAIDAGDQDMFFNLGYQYGSAKKAGTWQAGLEYRYLEGASYTPNLTDSDFAKGSLNHGGFVLSYKYAVTDFFTAALTYIDSDTIDDDYTADVVAKDDVQLLQIDAAVKF